MNFDKDRLKRISSRMVVVTVLAILLLSSAAAFFNSSNMPGNLKTGNSYTNTPDASASGYTVTFVESGLPSAHRYLWSVVFDNITERSSGSKIVFSVPDGTYTYTIEHSFNYYPVGAAGKVVVNGSNKIVNVNFAGKTYLVTFSVSDYTLVKGGLSNYNTWSVDFNGMNNTTMSSSVNFLVQNGTYTYKVTAPSGYSSTPAAGSVTVNGANVLVGINFNSTLYQVTFGETGLPLASSGNLVPEWHVTVSGTAIPSALSLSSNSSALSLSLPAGTYTYSLGNPNGYYSSPSQGQFTITDSSLSESIQFTPVYYNLVFSEKGLPTTAVSGSFGTEWGVKIVNTTSGASFTQYSSSPEIYFYANNGSYTYYVLNLTDYSIAQETGTVIVNGYNFMVPVEFFSSYAAVTFQENGLPSYGNPATVSLWTVTLVSQASGSVTTESSNSTSLYFMVVPGTYSYSVGAISGFAASSSTGTLNAGITPAINETFTATTTYFSNNVVSAVTFVENGLPANTHWTVTLVNSSSVVSYSSNYQDIVVYTNQGSYFYTVSGAGSYIPDVPSGVFNSTSPVSESITFSDVYQSLVFKESGLPYNTTWKVALQNPSGTSYVSSSRTGSISFNVPNGTYYYRLLDTGYYHPQNSLGSIVVNGSQITPSGSTSIKFVNSSSVLTFSESGLPAYTKWTVSLLYPGGSLVSRSTSYGSLNYIVQNGTYRFFAYSVGFYHPSQISGVVTSSGSSQTLSLSFTKHVHYITFNENGLPAGTSWSVVLGGSLKHSSTGSNITFAVNNGTFYYMVQQSGNYRGSVTSGTLYLSGSNPVVNVTFAKRFYTITVNEVGLITGTPWNVTLGGKLYGSLSNTITIQKENGSYNYSLIEAESYYPAPSDGLVSVAGANVVINVTFVSQLYTVTFHNSNLPAGILWGVVLSNSMQKFSNSSNTLTFEVSNGSYSYNIQGSNHYIPTPAAGTIIVSGGNVSVNVTFTIYKYAVTFQETGGLPSGDTWYVNVTSSDGTIYTKSTTGTSMTFNLLNGTYSYRVASANKSVSAFKHGIFSIQGANQDINFQFSIVQYSITFKETGLPANTTWYMVINGQNETVVSDNFSLLLSNGTYSYTVVNVNGYNATANTGSVSVNGANSTVQITYKPVSKTYVVKPPTPTSVPFNKVVLYILIGIGGVGLLVIFVVYTRGRRS